MNSGIKSADIMYYNKIMYLKFNFIEEIIKMGCNYSPTTMPKKKYA